MAVSSAIEGARKRRIGALEKRRARIEWFIETVVGRVRLTMRKRVALATALVKDEVIRNISRPVTKKKGPRGGTIVTDRSKWGEFPKADTTLLLKSIFSTTRVLPVKRYMGYVGTTLDYGLILEIDNALNRSFLVRTLKEQRSVIKRILTGPIRT